jgi:heme oxygenase
MSAPPALYALRRATAADHSALENEAGIERRLASPADRTAVVAAFHHFHAGLEPGAHPLIAGLDGAFRPRSRAQGIARDLRDLGVTPKPVPPLEPPTSLGAALGWVYVAEGSMLGGRIIRRRLAAAGCDLRGLSFLDPDGDHTGERWRTFLVLLEQTCAEGMATIDQVVRGGKAAFAYAGATLRPANTRAET